MKRFYSIAVLVSFLAVAGGASGTSITLNEVGVNNAAIVNGTFGSPLNGTYNVYAGYYQLSINGGKAVNGFCVDPALAPTSAGAYDLRAIVDPASVYAKAAYLFSQSNPGNAAAVQIAIWETVMDIPGVRNDFTWNHPDQTLKKTVDDLLSSLTLIPSNFDLSRYSLAVSPGILGNDGSGYGIGFQDYIVQNTPVPEPATMALLGAGIVGLAAFRTRSKHNHPSS